MSFTAILPAVIDAVRHAADRLEAEFLRPGGPRGSDDKAVVDAEIERDLHAVLMALLPARFTGEETGLRGLDDGALCWLVDPHDGTRAFLQGLRGSAVSVGLLHQGIPVLGVVCAPLPPDRDRDLIAWAEGTALTRNAVPVAAPPPRGLEPGTIVLLNHASAERPLARAALVAPARYIALPSVAYRLARVAAGEAVATASYAATSSYDYAGGHALLRGAGLVLLDAAGHEVTYTLDGVSAGGACFGGTQPAASALAARKRQSLDDDRRPLPPIRRRRAPALQPRYDRAAGCLLGQVIGDSLGSLVEFQTADAIRQSHPRGVRDLADGGPFNLLAGQPTDDSELALALARGLIGTSAYDPERIAAIYARWHASDPPDEGNTTRQAFAALRDGAAAGRAAASRDSQANGSLMRVAPIGIWARDAAHAAAAAAEDSRLSHPHPVCIAACAAYAAAIAEAVATGDRRAMATAAQRAAAHEPAVAQTLRAAADGRFPPDYQSAMGWVLIALQNAFAHLALGSGAESALIATAGEGGDSDTNAAITGALLGAADGRAAFPARWVLPVLSCRATARPQAYWPDDVLLLAEALLADH